MNHQLHFWFDNARFALKPLRQTQNEVVVQWHWLRKPILKPRTKIREDQYILAQAGLIGRNWGANLAHRRNGAPIQTGQTFWNLIRVAAICGAAETTDEDFEFDKLKDFDEDYDEG
ncbi:hypothetical protein VTK56DRAFT_7493 [Thermocarpiscus australiensis]